MRKEEGSTSGSICLLGTEQFNVDKAIIGAGGIHPLNGISDYHLEEAMIRRKMIDRAQKVIVVAEPSKFGIDSFAAVCPLSDVDIIITSNDVNSQIRSDFMNRGVSVIAAREN